MTQLSESGQAGALTFQEGLQLAQREIVRWADYEYDAGPDWSAVEASRRIFAIYERVRRVVKSGSNAALSERISSAADSI
jgi:hypothetical protein